MHDRTMPTIAHISDLHFNCVASVVAAALVADLQENPPQVLAITGDLTQRGRRRQYAAAAAFIRQLPKPQILTVGNHDIPLFDILRRIRRPLDRYRQYITDELAPFYHIDSLAIAALNTACSWTWRWNGFWRDGRISSPQLRQLEDRVRALAPATFKILVTHHPFLPPPRGHFHPVVGAEQAVQIFEQLGIDMILSGHLHKPYSGDLRTYYPWLSRSMLCSQAGTAISTRRRRDPNAYNVITVDSSDITIATRCWNGSAFEQSELARYPRPANVPPAVSYTS